PVRTLRYLMRWPRMRRQVIDTAFWASPAWLTLIGLVAQHCGPAFVERLYVDAGEISLDVRDVIAEFGPERVYLPYELERRVREAGFVDFQYATEGSLVCNWLEPPVSPRYEGMFRGVLSVWECLFRKPTTVCVTVDPALHYEAARAAECTPVYQEPL